MKKPWSLYNKEDKLRIDDLSAEQVRIVLLATATSRMKDWYAHQDGDVHWQPITSVAEFYEDVHRNKMDTEPTPQPKAQRRPLFEDPPADFKTDPTLQVEPANTRERRSARRYHRSLVFKVELNGQEFQSETVDVSMSGLSLRDPLPGWVPKTFQAHLILNNQSIQVLCSKVEAKKLRISDSSSWNIIRNWIVS